MILSKSILKIAAATCLLLLMPIGESKASKYIYLTTDIGLSYGTTYTTLDDYWHKGLVLRAGFRLPLFIFKDYLSLNSSIEYHYYPFDNSAVLPIKTIEGQQSLTIDGKSTSILSLKCIPTLFFAEGWRKFRPYITLGIGYMKRSDTVLKSDIQYDIESTLRYNSTVIYIIGIGLDFKIGPRTRGVVDYSGNVSSDMLYQTNYAILSFGIAYQL